VLAKSFGRHGRVSAIGNTEVRVRGRDLVLGFMFQCFTISTSFLISVLIVMGAGPSQSAERGLPTTGEMVEQIIQPSRVRTVFFADQHKGECPQFTSLIYSAVNRFVFVIPMSGLGLVHAAAYPNRSADTGVVEIIFENSSCRYKMIMKKFIRKDGIEIELLPRNAGKKFSEIMAEFNKRMAEINKLATKPQENQSKDDNTHGNLPVEIESGKIILRLDQIDPDKSGVTSLGYGFESEDSTMEFSGIAYFAPKSATFFIVNVPDYTIESHPDAAKKSYEINISNPKSRLSISIQKEVLGNGWTVVFGK